MLDFLSYLGSQFTNTATLYCSAALRKLMSWDKLFSPLPLCTPEGAIATGQGLTPFPEPSPSVLQTTL